MGKPTMWFLNRSDTNRFKKKWDCTFRVAKTKVLIAVTEKLICVFVFAYANCWFSHEAALFFFCLCDIGSKLINYGQTSKQKFVLNLKASLCLKNIGIAKSQKTY